MKNIGLSRVKTATADNFTTDFGIKARRALNPITRKVFSPFVGMKVHVESYPKLEKNKPYIFVSTHSYSKDTISNLVTIDRSAYTLIGTTDQVDHNPIMYGAWVFGMIYVNRNDNNSRKESLKKMERVLKSGSSLLIFPEGGFNNTENKPINDIFASPYILAKKTGCEVVPISNFNEYGSKDIYIRVGKPLKIDDLEKEEALKRVRDEMGLMMADQIRQYSTPIKRSDIVDIEEARVNFMEERKNEYLKERWSRDVWEEELTVYKNKNIINEEDVFSCLEDVEVNSDNFQTVAPALIKHYKEKRDKMKFDFKKYMHENWNK